VRPELCVGAVIVDAGNLLLVRRARPPAAGAWSVPGGRVEAGETMAAALTREVAEETGLVVRTGGLVGWVERISADHHFVIFDFAATVVAGQLRAGDDAAEVAWAPLSGLRARDDLVDGLLAFLDEHGVLA
jgi:8-oxo-dGTP diphosphatase